MKLLNISLARSIWLFPLYDLNPRGKDLHSFIGEAVQRYNFDNYPKPGDAIDYQKGVKFEFGSYNSLERGAISVNLTIYNDGVVADTRSSTQDSDAFLAEILGWTCTKYAFRPYDEVIRSKAYVSEVFVRTEKSLNVLNPRLEAFTKKLNSLVTGHDALSYETAAISFWNDPTLNATFPFRFERQENIGFKENRYYSIAALGTEIHLSLLDELESILA